MERDSLLRITRRGKNYGETGLTTSSLEARSAESPAVRTPAGEESKRGGPCSPPLDLACRFLVASHGSRSLERNGNGLRFLRADGDLLIYNAVELVPSLDGVRSRGE